VQIWPSLRETHDQFACNIGSSRSILAENFPEFSFSECAEEWNYEGFTKERATERAEDVRRRLKELTGERYERIVVITHRGFAAFLVGGGRFGVCGKFF